MWLIRIWLCIVFLLFALGMFSLAKVALAAGTLQATITWKNTDQGNQIRVEKRTGATTEPFLTLNTLSPLSTSYVDATNTAGERACYRLAYWNGVSLGPYSAVRCKTFSLTGSSSPSTVAVQ